MPEPRIVYAVTSGEYSDYRVEAIFEMQAGAEQAQRAGLGDGIIEITYYPAGAPGPTAVTVWRAGGEVRLDGTGWTNEAYSRTEWTADPTFRPPIRPRVQEHSMHASISVSAEALTKEAAEKAVSDRVAKLRAERLEAQP